MRVVLLAYQTWGCATIRALLNSSHTIALVAVHPEGEPRSYWDESVTALAQSSGLAVVERQSVNDEETRGLIAAAQPDVILSSNWQTWVSPDVCALAKHGGLNIHDAPLPRYGGFGPINWAIVNGETATAVTIHKMDAQFDTGDILIQYPVPIAFTDTATDVDRRIIPLFGTLAVEALDAIEDGRARFVKQDLVYATFYHRRTERDSRIDWTRTALDVYNLIRAGVDPYHNAHTTLDGARLKIKRASLPDKHYGGTPGKIFTRVDRGVVVVCGRDPNVPHSNQGIVVEQVEVGGETLDAARFFKGKIGGYLGE